MVQNFLSIAWKTKVSNISMAYPVDYSENMKLTEQPGELVCLTLDKI